MSVVGWSRRRKLTIDSSKVDSNQSDMQVLVKLTSGNMTFANAMEDGEDIRFTEADGETLLDYEFERYDSAGEKAEIWVRVLSLLSGSDIDFYLYYGKPGSADAQSHTNVWPTSDYVMVQHLNEESGVSNYLLDETSNDCDGAPSNASFIAESEIDGGRDLVGSGQSRVEFPHDTDMEVENFTIEILTHIESIKSPDHNPVIFKGSQIGWGTTVYMFRIKVDSTSSWGIGVCSGGIERTVNFADNITGSYKVIAMTHGSGGAAKGYIDGVYKGQIVSAGGLSMNTGYGIRSGFGYRSNGSEETHCDEKVAEIRMHKVERSADWLKVSTNSMLNTLLTYGGEEELITYSVSGVTRDSAGSVLVSCTVWLFRTSDKSYIDSTTSHASTGAYSFTGLGTSGPYFVLSHKDDSPHVFGTTDDDLTGVEE